MHFVEIRSPEFWQIAYFPTWEEADKFVAKFNGLVADMLVRHVPNS